MRVEEAKGFMEEMHLVGLCRQKDILFLFPWALNPILRAGNLCGPVRQARRISPGV